MTHGDALDDEPTVRLLLAPADGLPPVVADEAELARTAAALAAGSGPVAVDAERASGYRYGQRAYLVQLRRTGAGTALIDPIACPDLSVLAAAVADEEWVLHAASQDLPCLSGVHMSPHRLFDTELAARLAGFERVGLGAIVEQLLGIRLEKGHSAADWSRRPLPEPWLRYAALDVEVLVELRDVLEAELARQSKLEFARQEFAALAAAPLPAPRREPWRRTSGIHRVRNRRQLAALREVWKVRDDLARARDIAPGRLLPDAALIALATSGARTADAVTAVPGMTGRGVRRQVATFAAALRAAAALPETELPTTGAAHDGPPPPSRWADRDPQAADRLAVAREAVRDIAARWRMPVENLVSPELVRRLAWDPPQPESPGDRESLGSSDAVADRLTAGGARAWQVELTAGPLAAALGSVAAAPQRAGAADGQD